MRFTAVIPARYEARRLPGKPLLEIAGKPLIQWVYERASQASLIQEVWVATDDRRIFEKVESFGGKVAMTRADHGSGTERVAEVAERLEGGVVVNIQGDEPLISPRTIDGVCRPFLETDWSSVVTARVPMRDPGEEASPDAVKVVTDLKGRALYFSRGAIPYGARRGGLFKHIGIYAYPRDLLLRLARLEPVAIEETERLEQLRWLAHGIEVRVVEAAESSVGVDTVEDVERVRVLLENTCDSGGEASGYIG